MQGSGFLPFLCSIYAGLAWSWFGTGNALSRISWANIKTGLRRKCMHEDGAKEQGVCCYMPDGKPRKCHIPWGVRILPTPDLFLFLFFDWVVCTLTPNIRLRTVAACDRFSFCDR